MYERILLAYDGSAECRSALREGAMLAARCGAKVYLLSVVWDTPGIRAAEGLQAGAVAQLMERYEPILDEGLAKLRALGFDPTGKIVFGEPAQEIGAWAREIKADLVVVGHRRQSFIERWWSGSSGAYLTDHVGCCSVLVSRNVISEEQFRAAFEDRVANRPERAEAAHPAH
jgi:nucleotide-binding universal stress UspA family protein